jgi:ribonuclease HI
MVAGLVLFFLPGGDIIPYTFHLEFDCTNNVTEYEALLLGLQIASEKKTKILRVFRNSDLIVQQVRQQCFPRTMG